MSINNIYGLSGGCQKAPIYPVLPVDFDYSVESSTVTLTWDDENADYDFVEIEFKTDDTDWVKLGEFFQDVETFDHTDAPVEGDIFYRLRARKRLQWSTYIEIDTNED